MNIVLVSNTTSKSFKSTSPEIGKNILLLQQSFFSKLEENIDADSMAVFLRTLEIMNQNMDRLLEEKN